MNRSVIKGTANHKASIAKAKAKAKATSIVSQRRTQADAGLIAAADALGKSYKPAAIDFELDKINVDVPEKKEKKEKQPKVKKEKQPRVKKEKKVLTEQEKAERRAKRKETRGRIVDGVKTAIGGIVGVPLAIGKGLFKFGEDIIDEFGQKVEGAVEDIKTKGAEDKNKRAEKKIEKEAAKLEADKLKQADLEKREIEKALALERRNEEKLKKRLIREEAAERRKNRNKKKGQVYELDSIKTEGVGDKQINQYTKEQRERLSKGEAGGNVWSEEQERYVLPEEIIDGEFVSKAEGTKIDIYDESKNVKTQPVVEEITNTTDTPKMSDFKTKKNPFGGTITAKDQYEKALKEYYSKSPATMRDNRIYRNAVKGGVVQRNMIKSGYKPE